MARLFAVVLVLLYTTVAGMIAGMPLALKVLAGMLVPLACIWFPEAMGEFTGGGRSRITRGSPPSLVLLLGWIVLLLPLAVGTLFWLQGVEWTVRRD